MKIAIAGTGYVGLSNAMLFAQHHETIALDILQTKVDLLNNQVSPIQDHDISFFLKEKKLKIPQQKNPQNKFQRLLWNDEF
mgnify:CR=1 FL=1